MEVTSAERTQVPGHFILENSAQELHLYFERKKESGISPINYFLFYYIADNLFPIVLHHGQKFSYESKRTGFSTMAFETVTVA